MPVLASLLADLTCGDDECAEAAASLLPEWGEPAFVALRDLSHSKYEDTRWWAVRALAGWPRSDQVIRELVTALEDESIDVRRCAAVALSRHPDPQAISPLISVLSDADTLTAKLAANALIQIGAQAVPALIELLQSGAHTSRLEAVRALAQIEDPHAIPVLMKVLGEDSTVMQYWAEHGLNRLGLGMLYLKPQ
jgi:HEAT repeat protein